MKESTARFVLGIAVPAATTALLGLPYLLFRGDLPDRVATHFDGSGTPNGSMTPAGLLLFTGVMVAAGVGGCVWLARTRRKLLPSVAPMVGFLAGFFAGLGSGIAAVTYVGQRGLDDWAQADSVWVLIVVPILVAVVCGALSARAASALPVIDQTTSVVTQPSMHLGAGERVVWAETLHSRWLFWLGAILFAISAFLAITTSWWTVLAVLIGGVVTISLATLHVRADCQGLHVRYGLLPWPRTTVTVSQMASASVIDVRPMEWGGWGYRGSLKLMKQAAVVHRSGPGIRVDLRDGKVFVVTVDNPETPVSLLNAEIERQRSTTRST